MNDIILITDIMIQSFRSAFKSIMSSKKMEECTRTEGCQKMFENIIKEKTMTIIIGNDAGILVWYKRNDGDGEIAAIHTLPASWGSGLGHALLTEGIRQMRSAGIYSIYLWAFKENTRARRFYEKHGFHWTFQERESEFDGAIEILYELNFKK